MGNMKSSNRNRQITSFRCITMASSCLHCFCDNSAGSSDFDMNSALKLRSSSSSWLSSSTNCTNANGTHNNLQASYLNTAISIQPAINIVIIIIHSTFVRACKVTVIMDTLIVFTYLSCLRVYAPVSCNLFTEMEPRFGAFRLLADPQGSVLL